MESGRISGSNSSVAAAATAAADRDGLKQAATAFEAVFVRQMIASMRSAGLGEDLLGSSAGDQFRDMSDARIADSMAHSGGLGIATMLLKQFEGRI